MTLDEEMHMLYIEDWIISNKELGFEELKKKFIDEIAPRIKDYLTKERVKVKEKFNELITDEIIKQLNNNLKELIEVFYDNNNPEVYEKIKELKDIRIEFNCDFGASTVRDDTDVLYISIGQIYRKAKIYSKEFGDFDNHFINQFYCNIGHELAHKIEEIVGISNYHTETFAESIGLLLRSLGMNEECIEDYWEMECKRVNDHKKSGFIGDLSKLMVMSKYPLTQKLCEARGYLYGCHYNPNIAYSGFYSNEKLEELLGLTPDTISRNLGKHF